MVPALCHDDDTVVQQLREGRTNTTGMSVGLDHITATPGHHSRLRRTPHTPARSLPETGAFAATPTARRETAGVADDGRVRAQEIADAYYCDELYPSSSANDLFKWAMLNPLVSLDDRREPVGALTKSWSLSDGPLTTGQSSGAAPVDGGVPLQAVTWPENAQVLTDGHAVALGFAALLGLFNGLSVAADPLSDEPQWPGVPNEFRTPYGGPFVPSSRRARGVSC